MSWQATAFVLEHGPRLDDLDRNGKPYRARARGMRAVLGPIANTANEKGEHAHPGVATIVSESLYSKAQVLAIIGELVAEGWLIITEQGRGRGHATVYALVMDRRKVQSPDAPSETKGPVSDPERSGPEGGKVRSERSAPHPQQKTNDVQPVTPAAVTSADRAKVLVEALWDRCEAERRPKPTLAAHAKGNPFMALVHITTGFLDAGWVDEQVAAGLWETQAYTTNSITVALNRRYPKGGASGRSMIPNAAQAALLEHRRNRGTG